MGKSHIDQNTHKIYQLTVFNVRQIVTTISISKVKCPQSNKTLENYQNFNKLLMESSRQCYYHHTSLVGLNPKPQPHKIIANSHPHPRWPIIFYLNFDYHLTLALRTIFKFQALLVSPLHHKRSKKFMEFTAIYIYNC